MKAVPIWISFLGHFLIQAGSDITATASVCPALFVRKNWRNQVWQTVSNVIIEAALEQSFGPILMGCCTTGTCLRSTARFVDITQDDMPYTGCQWPPDKSKLREDCKGGGWEARAVWNGEWGGTGKRQGWG